MDDLALPFSEEEIKLAIDDMPKDKAPGPDGFTTAFFSSCWEIIQPDFMRVIDSFSELSIQNFQVINSANVVLLPKKDGADSVLDFRPISLIHIITKIITKAMARRLSPKMNNLVSHCQSAFIKNRSIHDNFMYVRNTVRSLHRARKPMLLVKLDIAKAFDSMRWDYLLDVMRRRGFPPRWRAWVSILFSTATSRVLLNGIPGLEIIHGRGLRQGDPLSPLLFDIGIDPLNRTLQMATEQGLLHPLPVHLATLRLSLYADDAAIFIAPTAHDITNLVTTLHSFGEATGLVTNFANSSISPIRCEDVDFAAALHGFPAVVAQFPIKYLGLPLAPGRLRRADVQPYIDKLASRLQPWKARFLNRAGCNALVKSVLSYMPIFLLTAIKADKAVLTAFDKIRRGMLWNCSEIVGGGKCKINWDKVCRPKILGGLGILNLEKFSRALRLRWLWHEWASPHKPWVGTETLNDDNDRNFFTAATRVTVGNGLKASF